MNIQLSIYKWEQREFLNYLGLADDTLKRHEKKLNKWIKEYEAKVTTDEERSEFDAWVGDEAESLRLHKDLIFESFIIWLHGYLEKQLNNLCNKLRKELGLELQLSDIAGKGIERATLFLKKACRLKLPEGDIWKELICLREIRNAIVHNEGIIIKNQKEKELKRFIDQQDEKGISYFENGKIILGKIYCEKAVDAVFVYLKKLIELNKPNITKPLEPNKSS